MSRSYKKSPCVSYVCYFSNKQCKKIAHKLFRARERHGIINDKYLPFRLKEVSDVWDFDSDGLPRWRNNLEKKFLRK